MINNKNLSDLDIFDTVWVQDTDKNILTGWVYDINKKHIIVTIPTDDKFIDIRFKRDSNNTKNYTLLLNKP